MFGREDPLKSGFVTTQGIEQNPPLKIKFDMGISSRIEVLACKFRIDRIKCRKAAEVVPVCRLEYTIWVVIHSKEDVFISTFLVFGSVEKINQAVCFAIGLR